MGQPASLLREAGCFFSGERVFSPPCFYACAFVRQKIFMAMPDNA
jgi:hypothetical protein